MSLFVVSYTYVDDPPALEGIRPVHREFLSAQPGLVLSGPTDDGGAVLIFEAGSAADLESLLDADPFHVSGLIEARRVQGWSVVLGRARDLIQS